MKNKNNTLIRVGLKDLWNSAMVDGAIFSKENDIPYCPTILSSIPRKIITWEEAKTIYAKKIRKRKDFYVDAFVCFYIDDYKFDGLVSGVWWHPKRAMQILKHFKGIITVDYSTYVDFPDPINRFNTYRMRAFGYWIGKNGLEVVNNVRWGYSNTYSYSFDGIDKNSVIAIGTVGGSPRKLVDRNRFEEGILAMVDYLYPHTILVYGSANYPIFDVLREKGINIVDYKSRTAIAYEERLNHE